MKIQLKLLLGCLLVGTVLPLFSADKVQYKELRTPKPEDWRKCAPADFQIDLERVASHDSKGFLYGNQEGLLKLAHFYKENPEGIRLWKSKQSQASRLVNNWYFFPGGFERHIYKCFSLDHWAFLYALTGHKLLGNFVHDHIMQIANLPEDFWLHQELRSYKPDRPYGEIETGQLAKAVAGAMSLAGDLFTPDEELQVRNALRQKGVKPMLNYLEDAKTVANFLAVVAVGTHIAGKYLEDPQVSAIGKSALLRYINGSVESDGSYGEGTGYFSFPMGMVLYSVAAMAPEERKSFLEQSGLKHSPKWLAYPYLYSTIPEEKALRCVFADNSYQELPSMVFLGMIADIYNDPTAAWLGRAFNAGNNISWRCFNFAWMLTRFSDYEALPEDSNKVLELPLIRGFENGENFIRTSWEPDSTVLALYTAGPTRIHYNHQRPERNSINLGVYGEYFIVSPHSSSYRSQIHYDYDRSTLSANTIRIDNGDQLMPFGKPSWGKNPPYVNFGKPVGKLVLLNSNGDFEVMAGDARRCYKEKLSEALRLVLYRRSQNYFIVIDRMSDAEGKPHTYTALWHLNNRDEQLKLTGADTDSMLAERPRADLAVFTGADCELNRSITDGYMHGAKRDYSPGGVNEGKLGSAKVLNVANAQPQKTVTFVTVLQPLHKGESGKAVAWKDGKLTVGDDVWSVDGKTVRFGNLVVPLRK